MQIFIAGGTGFIGPHLIRRFLEGGHTVKVLVRDEKKIELLPPGTEIILGDPTKPGPWQKEAGQCEVAVNLTGANIFARWSREYKKKILQSRVASTRYVLEALASAKGRVLLNASATGYYGAHRGEEEITEESRPGGDFLAQVCQAWEQEALCGEKMGLRVIIMRLGVVLGKNGGALAKMLPAFRLGLGGPIGSGKQWLSWIHIKDVAEAAYFLIRQETCRGPFNFVAPHPVRQKDFALTLGRLLRRPAIVPVPALFLRLLLGEMAGLLLGSLRVYPQRLLSVGYQFFYPHLDSALKDLLTKER